VLDLERSEAGASWHLKGPGEDALPLEGTVSSLTVRQMANGTTGAVAAGILFDGSAAPQLFVMVLDARLCVIAAWRRPLEPPEAILRDLLALPDGGLALGGSVAGPEGDEDRDAWIARFGPKGDLLWQVAEGEFLYTSDELNTPSREAVQALAISADLGLIAAGAADINQALHSNWLLVLDRDGRLLRRIDLPRDDPRVAGEMMALAPADDGSLWLAGVLAPLTPDADAWLLRLGKDDAVLWDRRYGEPKGQWVGAAAAFDNGGERGLLVVGRQEAEQGSDAWVTAVDGSGVPLWSSVLKRQANGTETFDAALSTGAALVAGGSYVPRGEPTRAWLASFDPGGRQVTVEAPDAKDLRALLAWSEGRLLAGGSDLDGRPLLFLTTVGQR
jgi:hypothetical protein